jgi:hypothetical protein
MGAALKSSEIDEARKCKVAAATESIEPLYEA